MCGASHSRIAAIATAGKGWPEARRFTLCVPDETPVPRECTGRFVAGPAVGIPLGLGTAAFGGVLVYAATNSLRDSLSSESRNNNAPGAIAGGAILVGAGLAAFLYSTIKLRKNLEARRRVCGRRNGYQPFAHRLRACVHRVVFDRAGIRF